MITFSKLGKHGRLGNQLFQIASTIGIALDNDCEYVFPEWFCEYTGKNYASYFKRKLPYSSIENVIELNETSYQYFPFNNLKNDLNYDLFGYFQSEKYFLKYRDIIVSYFEPLEKITEQLESQFGQYLQNSCSIHVRRGDYLDLKHVYNNLQPDYYFQSISRLYNANEISKINYLVFSDDKNWCFNNLKLPNMIIVDIQDELLELFLMSKCCNNIIANSSFSWWGAWLNKSKDKKVVSPGYWFTDSLLKNQSLDLYPNDWIIQ